MVESVVSPDGRHIAFAPALGPSCSGCEIWLMDSQGDNPHKVLKLGENEFLCGIRWSPDGQRLAYIRVQRTSKNYKASIETCDLKGANRTVVVPGSDLYLGDLCWLPEGRIVYSRGEPHSINDGNLWQISVDGQAGAPTGKPKRITQWAGSYITQLFASADGKRLTFLKQAFQQQVYLGQLVAGGTHMNPPGC